MHFLKINCHFVTFCSSLEASWEPCLKMYCILPHTSCISENKMSKILSLTISIFDIKVMVKSSTIELSLMSSMPRCLNYLRKYGMSEMLIVKFKILDFIHVIFRYISGVAKAISHQMFLKITYLCSPLIHLLWVWWSSFYFKFYTFYSNSTFDLFLNVWNFMKNRTNFTH